MQSLVLSLQRNPEFQYGTALLESGIRNLLLDISPSLNCCLLQIRSNPRKLSVCLNQLIRQQFELIAGQVISTQSKNCLRPGFAARAFGDRQKVGELFVAVSLEAFGVVRKN